MRDICFRAWDRRHEKMHYQSRFAHFNDFYLTFEGGLVHVVGSSDVSDYNEEIDGKPLIILMQYIGLKDRNGKMIYEGDIVDTEDMDGNLCEGKVVKWGTVYPDDTSYYACDTWMVDVNDRAGVGVPVISNDTIVVGNIHENPELLK